MQREMELCRQAEEELVKKNYQFQKTIKMMNIKIQAQDLDNQDIQSLEEARGNEAGDSKEATDKNVKALEEKLSALRHKHILSLREQDALRKQLEEARSETKRMQLLKDDAKDFLISCLEDARKQFTVQTGENREWTPDQPIPWSLQGLSAAGREALLEYLLARLGGTNFGETKKSLGRNSRMASNRGGGRDSPMSAMGTTGPVPTQNVVNMDGGSLPPIGQRQSPAPGDEIFGTWGAKAHLPNTRAQKVYH